MAIKVPQNSWQNLLVYLLLLWAFITARSKNLWVLQFEYSINTILYMIFSIREKKESSANLGTSFQRGVYPAEDFSP